MALQWQSLGAPRIHIVDLDGAASGDVVNLDIIETIANAVQVPTQLGGGIRTMDTIAKVLKMGVERVILGTIAVENQELVKEVCHKYRDAIIVSIDGRDGQVATRGWIQGTQVKAVALAREMVKLGVRRFIYTEITRDGTLIGPNYSIIAELVDAIQLPIIAAGGVTTLEDIKVLKKIGAEGAIVGKALYTGHIDLKQALAIAQ